MTPLFFGESSRRLFGLYTPAHATGRKQRGIVLCHPWGQEYLRAHRSMSQLCRMLAAAGYHVLSFDYFGTGDSAGDMKQADLNGWQTDVETAINELKDTAGLQRVGLLGLRLGGTLAARAAVVRRRDVDALVLWDPVLNGRDYLSELRHTDALIRAEQPALRRGPELLGFPMEDEVIRQLETIDLVQHAPVLPARTFIAVSARSPVYNAWQATMDADSADSRRMELIEDLPAWLEDRHSGAGAIPVKLLQRMVEWLA